MNTKNIVKMVDGTIDGTIVGTIVGKVEKAEKAEKAEKVEHEASFVMNDDWYEDWCEEAGLFDCEFPWTTVEGGHSSTPE